MVTLSSDSRPIIGRGSPLGASFFFLAVVSITLMVLDHRSNYLETAKMWMGMATQPFYTVVQAPFDAWNWLRGSFADRDRLRRENARLEEELRVARIRALQFEALYEENRRLRAIRAASDGIAQKTLIAEIIRVDIDPFRHRVRINKGSEHGVFKGQPVLDAFGIVGQVTRVDHRSSELILISDNEHATPVQINRNGVRSIVVGTGDMHKLALPFLTSDADIKLDDLVVSSGLDGIFPAGYPVARITKVDRDPSRMFAVVEAEPMAHLDRAREVLLLWFDAEPVPPVQIETESEPPLAPEQARSP